MALVRNGRNVFASPGNFPGGAYGNQNGNFIKGGMKSRYTGGLSHLFGSYPNGYLTPHSFILPIKSGSISSNTRSISTTIYNANLIPAYNLECYVSLSITLNNAQLDQIVSFIASSSMTMNNLDAALAAAAGMFSSGSSSITVNSSQLGAIFSVLTNGVVILSTDSTLTANANMVAVAGGATELSPEGLAAAILNAMLLDYNQAGSVGEALNNIGASGNPWASDLDSNNNDGTFGSHVQRLLTQTKFIALKD